MGIQFFDHDALLPPPFTFLSIMVLIFSLVTDSTKKRRRRHLDKNKDNSAIVEDTTDQTYPQLIFSLLDGAKPCLKASEKEWRKKSRKVSMHPAENC